MDMMELYFNVISLSAGIWFLYTWFRLRKEKKLFHSQLLMLKDDRPENCPDEAGYIRFVSPGLLVVGLVCALTGAAGFLMDQTALLPAYFVHRLKLVGNALCILAVFGYMAVWSKGRKRFW